VCVCLNVIDMNTRVHTRVYVHISIYITQTLTRICIHIYTYIHTHVNMYTYIHIYYSNINVHELHVCKPVCAASVRVCICVHFIDIHLYRSYRVVNGKCASICENAHQYVTGIFTCVLSCVHTCVYTCLHTGVLSCIHMWSYRVYTCVHVCVYSCLEISHSHIDAHFRANFEWTCV